MNLEPNSVPDPAPPATDSFARGIEPPGSNAGNGSGEMFDRIADRYDRLNRLMSMGIDRRWRRRMIDALELGDRAKVLDVATGTADVAIAVHQRHPDAEIVGVDPSRRMLEVGERKVAANDLQQKIRLQCGDAQSLPFADDAFDACCIAFGIRNVVDRELGLREMARVTRPGGRVAVLELSEPQSSLLAPFARFYIRHFVPRVGALLSGRHEYRYLERSIAAFPQPAEFSRMMQRSGMAVVVSEALTFGVCHLFVGVPGAET